MPSPLNYSYFENHNSDDLLVVIHGLFGTMDNLSVVRRHFENKMNVLMVDLLNHGESSHVEHFSLDACVDALLPLLKKFRQAKVSIVGHSLGGKVAMRFALRYPDELDSLVVADIAPVTYNPRHDTIFKALKSVHLDAVSKRSDADKTMKEGIPEAGVRQFLLKSLYQDEQKHWHWRFNLAGLEANYQEIIGWRPIDAVFNKPTLFIKAGNSDYIEMDMQATIAGYFPKARAHVIEGVGHWLHSEKPDVFNRIIEKQLTRP